MPRHNYHHIQKLFKFSGALTKLRLGNIFCLFVFTSYGRFHILNPKFDTLPFCHLTQAILIKLFVWTEFCWSNQNRAGSYKSYSPTSFIQDPWVEYSKTMKMLSNADFATPKKVKNRKKNSLIALIWLLWCIRKATEPSFLAKIWFGH